MRRRNKTIKVRFTDDELKELDLRVKRTSMTREAYIRAVLADTVPVELPPIDYIQLLRELTFVSNNLNQIARKAHALGLLNYQEYKEEAEKVNYVVDTMLSSLHPQRKL